MKNSFHKYSRIFLSLALAGAPVLIALAFIMSKPAYAEAVMYSAQNGYCENGKQIVRDFHRRIWVRQLPSVKPALHLRVAI